jgi:antitoxin (DNA-binding transcriptional repressor) of toxin-antitoxin stability system
MSPTIVSTTDLKHNTGEILDLVFFKRQPIAIKRHGKIIAHLTPPHATNPKPDYAQILKKYSGTIPDLKLNRSKDTHRFNTVL